MPKLEAKSQKVNEVMNTLKLPVPARAFIVEIEDVKGPEFVGEFLLDAVYDIEQEKKGKRL